jgi:PPM family protein phosphatase
MNDIKVTAAVRSDVGRVRTNNEDAFAIADLRTGTSLQEAAAAGAFDLSEMGVLLAVSDGMGGHQAGEVASSMVLDSLRRAMVVQQSGPMAQKVEAAVRQANAEVVSAARSQNKKGMGATLTAVFAIGQEAYIAEVGDSRAYLCRNKILRQLTRDQSLVQMLVDGGMISPEDAKHSPNRNVILQAMGLADDVRVAIGRLSLRRRDTILICCDGVSNAIPDEEFQQILSSNEPRAAAARLIDLANERGGEDNLTVIVAQFDGSGLKEASSSESMVGTFEVIQAFTTAAPRPAASSPTPTASAALSRAEPRPTASPVAAVPSGSSARRRLVIGALVALVVVGAYFLVRLLRA